MLPEGTPPPPTISRRPNKGRTGLKWTVGVLLVLVLAGAGILAVPANQGDPTRHDGGSEDGTNHEASSAADNRDQWLPWT